MLFSLPTDRGLVRMIVIIVIALLLIAYFGFNLRSIVDSPTFQDNWHFIKDTVLYVWNTFLKGPAVYLWNLYVTLIWEPAIQNLEKMKNGEPDSLHANAPQLPVPPPAR